VELAFIVDQVAARHGKAGFIEQLLRLFLVRSDLHPKPAGRIRDGCAKLSLLAAVAENKQRAAAKSPEGNSLLNYFLEEIRCCWSEIIVQVCGHVR
jgi:hypothetical protein